jgi:hypothetical protein
MAPPNKAQTSPKVTGGRIHQVRCPWCGKPNDFRGMKAGMLIDKGSEFSCDHCRHVMIVVNYEQVEVISVRQHPTKVHPVSKEIRR